MPAGVQPSAAEVLTPTPWSENGLGAALSDPAVGPVLAPLPPPNADGKLLVPADVGPDWAYDPGSRESSTGEFVMDNGCTPDHSIFGLAAGRALGYTGSLPDGTRATGFEGEYRLPAGTGAKTMQDARTYARGGCDPAAKDGGFSQDTVTELPAGIGDGAFVENQPQQGGVRVTVRVGDTILQTDLTRADRQRLTLSSDADRAWQQRIAAAMVARYTGAAPRG